MSAAARAGGPRGVHPLVPVVAIAAWIGSVGNAALWVELARLSALRTVGGIAFGLAFGLMIMAALLVLLGLVCWRRSLKPVGALLLVATAVAAHFMLTYHAVIDVGMLQNVVQTDVKEARDLMSVRLFATVGLVGVLPAIALWRLPLRELPWRRRVAGNASLVALGIAALIGLGLASFQPLASTMRNHKHVRYLINPLSSLYAIGRLAAAPLQHHRGPLQALGTDATLAVPPGAGSKPPLLVLVVGEAARSGNFGLNGYPRPTTPELQALDVASFRNAWSCGTSTATSLPCMFSHLGRRGYETRDADYENLLDVLQHAGLAVLWLDNQSGCKGVCERVPHASTATLEDDALCATADCFDAVMLKGLDERIAALPAAQRARGVVVVMHQMGSHGPAYFRRSPKETKRFLPECGSTLLQDCSREEIVNAYDNSIAYTDHFLAETIRWLKAHEASDAPALLYVADHGESLGENNFYLHGLPYPVAPDVQKRIPWITWLGAGFAQRSGLDTRCMQERLRDLPLSHDHYFHSVLGLAGVRTAGYEARLDAYTGCRAD